MLNVGIFGNILPPSSPPCGRRGGRGDKEEPSQSRAAARLCTAHSQAEAQLHETHSAQPSCSSAPQDAAHSQAEARPHRTHSAQPSCSSASHQKIRDLTIVRQSRNFILATQLSLGTHILCKATSRHIRYHEPSHHTSLDIILII